MRKKFSLYTEEPKIFVTILWMAVVVVGRHVEHYKVCPVQAYIPYMLVLSFSLLIVFNRTDEKLMGHTTEAEWKGVFQTLE